MSEQQQITFGRFIFERIKQVGVKTIFGLPGDFNLALLDKLYEVEGLRWAGSANELNASYAADGYSRVSGLGVLITTFGVGELSALNGIAGAYAEHVGLVHIVGLPSVSAQDKKLLLHHTLGNGDFGAYHRMSQQISETTAVLRDISAAPAEVDRCIRAAYIAQRPVYIGIPCNLIDVLVPVSLLAAPVDLTPPPSLPESEEEVVNRILSLISEAKRPVIISDACAGRHDVKAEVEALMEASQFPSFTTPLGKGTIDESHPQFGGVYVGTLSRPTVKAAVESADLILSVGALLSDFNTGSFSHGYATANTIELHSNYVKIRNAFYPDVRMKSVLQQVVAQVKGRINSEFVPSTTNTSSSAAAAAEAEADAAAASPLVVSDETPLKQEWLWHALSDFLREGDIVITETGTAGFGINLTKFPRGVLGINQVLYGSIGFSVGAAVGAAFAAADSVNSPLPPPPPSPSPSSPSSPSFSLLPRRVILFVGDGSLQLTVQELSCLVRWGLTPYVFVLNNNGYTIERLIHGPTASYNDIQGWRHQLLLSAFGAKTEGPSASAVSVEVRTVGEWKALTTDAAFGVNDKLRLIELFLPEMDAPSSLIAQAKLTSSVNSK